MGLDQLSDSPTPQSPESFTINRPITPDKPDIPRRETEKQQKEALFQQLALPSWLERHLAQPGKLQEFESTGKSLIELGDPDNPAHAFRISFNNLDESQISQVNKQIERLFEKQSDSFVRLAERGGSDGCVLGFIVPSKDHSLESLLEDLKDLEAATHPVATDPHKIAILVSEAPERQLVLRQSTQKQLNIDAAQNVGLTVLSWLDKAMIQDPTLTEKLGPCTWLSPQFIEENRPILGRRNDLVATLGDALSVEAPKTKAPGTLMYARSLANLTHQPLPQETSPQLETILSPSTFLASFIEKHGSASAPSVNFLDTHAPGWEDQLTKEGFVRFAADGAHAILKLDLSGLSKLIAKGASPNEFMAGVLSDFIEPADAVFGADEYLLKTEGDAVILFIPLKDKDSAKIVTGLTQIIKTSGERFSQIIRQKSAGDNLGTPIEQQDLGMKAIIALPQSPSTVTFRRGGTWIADNSSLTPDAEAQAEKLAKQGGFTTTFIFEKPLSEAEEKSIFGALRFVKEESQDKFTYRVEAYKSLIEQELTQLIQTLPDSAIVTAQDAYKGVDKVITTLPPESFEHTDNILLSFAKFLSFMQKLQPDIQSLVIAQLGNHFGPQTAAHLLELHQKFVASDTPPVTDGEKSINNIYRILKAGSIAA